MEICLYVVLSRLICLLNDRLTNWRKEEKEAVITKIEDAVQNGNGNGLEPYIDGAPDDIKSAIKFGKILAEMMMHTIPGESYRKAKESMLKHEYKALTSVWETRTFSRVAGAKVQEIRDHVTAGIIFVF